MTPPKVLYIAGYGRSGSTFLDTLLGNHPEVFGSGEITHLFRTLAGAEECTCGEPVPRCPVWSAVADRVRSAHPNLRWEQALALTRRADGWGPGGGSRAYGSVWRSVFDAIRDITGKPWVVDSSKNGWDATRRVRSLREASDLDVRVVHLVRDPRAVVWARLRCATRLVDAPWSGRWGPDSSAGRALRAVVGWTAAQLRVRGSDLLVRYEDVVADPAMQLGRLGALMHVDPSPWVELVQRSATLDAGHGISGNRARRAPVVRFDPDVEWVEALPRYGRAIATLASPLARRYGYRR